MLPRRRLLKARDDGMLALTSGTLMDDPERRLSWRSRMRTLPLSCEDTMGLCASFRFLLTTRDTILLVRVV